MSKNIFFTTPAIRFLNNKKINYTEHQYEYTEKGGTKQTAIALDVNEHYVIKTLVFTGNENEFIVLMHGDLEVSTKELGRLLNIKKIEPSSAIQANKVTGYQFGGTSPFGTKKQLQIYIEKTILDLEKIYINGGKRGFILEMTITELLKAINIIPVKVGI
jgi:Cys-tRNA(Pro) deacylase